MYWQWHVFLNQVLEEKFTVTITIYYENDSYIVWFFGNIDYWAGAHVNYGNHFYLYGFLYDRGIVPIKL